MFFRQRGNNVQLVKSLKQADNKAKNTAIGSINLTNGKKNFKEGIKITSKDQRDIDLWLKNKTELMKLEAELDLKLLETKIHKVANDIQSGRVKMSENQFEEVNFAFSQLRKVFNKSIGL